MAEEVYGLATPQQLNEIDPIEQASYPPDEPASREKLHFRITEANDYFLVASIGGKVAGYVCSTMAEGDALTHESMEKHVPGGTLLCLHSVVVEASHRRKGLGTRMLKEYVARMKALTTKEGGGKRVARLALICKEHLIEFYTKCGFVMVGKSAVVHGLDPWFEMAIDNK